MTASTFMSEGGTKLAKFLCTNI